MEPDPRQTKLHQVVLGSDETAAPPPLRVLMLSAAGEVGGAERSLYELVLALPREKITPRVCVPPGGTLTSLFAGAGIAVHEVPLRRFRRTTLPFVLAGHVRALYQGSRAIAALCREHKIEVLHANTNSAALVAWEVGRITRLPFVWHCRDLTPLHALAKILSRAAAAVVAISGAVEEHLRGEGVPPAKIRRIDNGIDVARLCPAALRAAARARVRAALGIEAHRPVLLSIGGYVPWKKHELFLDALALVRCRLPGAVGLLAGSDTFGDNEAYTASLKARARHLSLGPEGLRVLNERDDVPDLMAAADVFVSCSEREPFGRVLAEAGGCGLPVVSTRSGGKPEIVEDGVTGILTPPGDVPAVAAAALKLLGDAGLRERMGDAARERVLRLYDVRRTARQVTELFEAVRP